MITIKYFDITTFYVYGEKQAHNLISLIFTGLDAPRRSKYGYELPSARKVSLKVSQGIDNPDNVRSFLFTVFGQFLDHDLTISPLSVLTVDDPTGNSFMVYWLK